MQVLGNKEHINYHLLMVGNFLTGHKDGIRGTRGVGEELAGYFLKSGLQVRTTSSRKNVFFRMLDMLWTVWHCRNIYDLAQVDVFSGRAFYWALFTCRLLSFLNKPFVLSLHGGNLPEFALKKPEIVAELLQMADVITTPSPYLKRALSNFGVDFRLVPNPIDMGKYPFALREQLRPHLVWLRAFHALYNPILAVMVFQKLILKYPDARLLMIGPNKGDGSLEDVKDLIKRLDLEPFIQVVAGVEKKDVPFWLQKGDIFLNTTFADNTPVSVLEAMACGLPVVSTNVGGIPDLLQDGFDALLVPPDSVDAMVDAVERLVNQPNLAQRLSANGREKSALFDKAKVLPHWHSIFKEVIASNAGAD